MYQTKNNSFVLVIKEFIFDIFMDFCQRPIIEKVTSLDYNDVVDFYNIGYFHSYPAFTSPARGA